MIKDLTIEQAKLESFMSDISERCYSAGWLQNLEFALWNALMNGPTKYGHGVISQHDIDNLIQLSKACNCWIVMDDITEETAIDLGMWQEMYKKHV